MSNRKELSEEQLKSYEIVSFFISRALSRNAGLAEKFSSEDAEKLRAKRFILNQRDGWYGVVSHQDPIIRNAIVELLEFSGDIDSITASGIININKN